MRTGRNSGKDIQQRTTTCSTRQTRITDYGLGVCGGGCGIIYRVILGFFEFSKYVQGSTTSYGVRLEEVAQFKLNTHGQLADNGGRSFVVSFAAAESLYFSGSGSSSGSETGTTAALVGGLRTLDPSAALGFAQLQGLRFVDQLQGGTAVVGGTGVVRSRELAKVQAVPSASVVVAGGGGATDGGAACGASAAGQRALRD